ncbi:hypothetical protein HKD37_10G027078 [Glycine soja]
MVKSVAISNNNLPIKFLRYNLHCNMAIATYPQVLHNPNCGTRACPEEAICNCQFFTMKRQCKLLPFLIQIK